MENKLRSILEKLRTQTKFDRETGELCYITGIDQAISQIKKLMLEIVGEDLQEPFVDTFSIYKVRAINQAKAEMRKRVEEL
jgi:hypothetical protein